MGVPQNRALTNRPEPPVFGLVRTMLPEIKAALPNLGITADRMCRMAITALRHTPTLTRCDQLSVISCIVELAQLGLEPNTPLGHGWLLPFGNKCQIIIGYKGMIALADRAGVTISAEVVYEKDHFVYPKPGDTVIDHVPSEDADRGALKYAYAYAMRGDRPMQWKVVNRADIARAMAASSAAKRGKSPWETDLEAMWRKTAVRRLCSFIPLSAEAGMVMARAIELSDQADNEIVQNLAWTPPATETIEARAEDVAQSVESARSELGCPETSGPPPAANGTLPGIGKPGATRDGAFG